MRQKHFEFFGAIIFKKIKNLQNSVNVCNVCPIKKVNLFDGFLLVLCLRTVEIFAINSQVVAPI